jgi:hypothetical protein
VRAILSDSNIEGHLRLLLAHLESPTWREIWHSLNLTVYQFADLRLAKDASDAELWQACQNRGVILITANRNAEGPDSLEATLRARNAPDSLPVLTLANADRILTSNDYADRVVERLLQYLLDIDGVRGAGRLYLP